MLTREQIEEIQAESREKGVPVKNLLKEKGIPDHQYFWWKRKYSKPEVPEGFLPMAGSGLPAAMASSDAHLRDWPPALPPIPSCFHNLPPLRG